MKKLLNPQSKQEQIMGVLEFYLRENELDFLRTIPAALNHVALVMFASKDGNDCHGYRANVVRKALNELASTGQIDYTGPIIEVGE